MENVILDTFLKRDKDPLEHLYSKVEDLVAAEGSQPFMIIKELQSSMSNFWKFYEALNSDMQGVRHKEYAPELHANNKAINHRMAMDLLDIVRLCKMLNLPIIDLKSLLSGYLEEADLQSIEDPLNVVQTLLQYGLHIITFKEMIPSQVAHDWVLKYLDDYLDRRAARKLGTIKYELTHKTSNEILIQSIRLYDTLLERVKNPSENSDKYNQVIWKQLFYLVLSYGTHWALLNADSLYMCNESYKLISDGNS